MSTFGPKTGPAPSNQPENAADRLRRVAKEAAGIAEAYAALEAGLYVDAAEIDAWIDCIGIDHELPPPPTRER